MTTPAPKRRKLRIEPSDKIIYSPVFLGITEGRFGEEDRDDGCYECELIDCGRVPDGGMHGAPCAHGDGLCRTRDGDVVCFSCGSVLFDGVDTFHVAGLEGAAYTYRKGTYKIKYYHNEKVAQWCRQCPKPGDDFMDRFVEEAKKRSIYGDPEGMGRRTVAKICRRLGRPTTQEKWILLLDLCKAKDPVYFANLKVPPKPSVRLRNEMRRLFLMMLPAWEMCKDIDAGEIIRAKDPKARIPAHYGKKRRKSYPHNYMMERQLWQIQKWYPDDPDLGSCFEIHQEAIKEVSSDIRRWWDVVYQKMVECLNDLGPIRTLAQ